MFHEAAAKPQWSGEWEKQYNHEPKKYKSRTPAQTGMDEVSPSMAAQRSGRTSRFEERRKTKGIAEAINQDGNGP
ncbi:hypothetical protein TNCV_1337431 [Trichonephila clavipes]|nr:hypothetical protein TNCV_1337431 [Trichonephila clavipes]